MLIDLERERCRRSFYAFMLAAWKPALPTTDLVPNWHIKAMCDALQAPTRRRVICVPPGSSKSSTISIFYPAWRWGPDAKPWMRFMGISYDTDLLNRDTEKLHRLLRSDWYRERWGDLLPVRGKIPTSNFDNLKGGGRFNTSIGGAGTGWHCHEQLIDDPIKAEEADYLSGRGLDAVWSALGTTFASRGLDPRTFARSLMMQRLAKGDPAGRAIEAGWVPTIIPMAYDPEICDSSFDPRTVPGELMSPGRISQADLDLTYRDMTPDKIDTQYQQRPGRKGGTIIEAAWIDDHAIDPGALPELRSHAQSWDLAFKGEATSDNVAGLWAGAAFVPGEGCDAGRVHYYLRDHDTARRTFVGTKAAIRGRRDSWPARVAYVENKANGPALESELREEWPGWIQLVEPKGSKVARVHAVAGLFKGGLVHMIRGPHFDRVRREFLAFPDVRNDDDTDAMSQYLLEARKGEGYLLL